MAREGPGEAPPRHGDGNLRRKVATRISLLPLREKVPEGRMRGLGLSSLSAPMVSSRPGCALSARAPSSDRFAATFSREGRREEPSSARRRGSVQSQDPAP